MEKISERIAEQKRYMMNNPICITGIVLVIGSGNNQELFIAVGIIFCSIGLIDHFRN